MFSPSTKILVVDDMMAMRKIVIKICKELGFTDITEANDGVKAWEAMTNAAPPFGLVISDWDMPNCTGLDLLKRVRGDQRHSTVPFVMVSEADGSQIAEAIKAGVSSYIVKPFNGETLKEHLETVHKKFSGA